MQDHLYLSAVGAGWVLWLMKEGEERRGGTPSIQPSKKVKFRYMVESTTPIFSLHKGGMSVCHSSLTSLVVVLFRESAGSIVLKLSGGRSQDGGSSTECVDGDSGSKEK